MLAANISGNRIKIARKDLKMDQIDLSAAIELEHGLKITQSDISEIERGVRGVKDFELDIIARVLNVSPLWLLRGNEE
ncbi:XRE family transcriptional regulator [Neobacillus piezotolerans]|uniref:XRE family transcriptional regulator n=1 Tax=Neobacillus piezotolerans TaxID=2259171 RepID=A0A3D8GWZ7_9BACI|nr:helix-turn-helix domain-containing protein [Neobacillus piezotolerans]RDU38912.1 XRE family transcriptional regulator [Neobacillus piezotolerans]